MTVKPLDNRVLVEVAEESEKTVSGIIIPDSAKEKPRMGKVVAVGTDEDLQEVIKKGDKILFININSFCLHIYSRHFNRNEN